MKIRLALFLVLGLSLRAASAHGQTATGTMTFTSGPPVAFKVLPEGPPAAPALAPCACPSGGCPAVADTRMTARTVYGCKVENYNLPRCRWWMFKWNDCWYRCGPVPEGTRQRNVLMKRVVEGDPEHLACKPAASCGREFTDTSGGAYPPR